MLCRRKIWVIYIHKDDCDIVTSLCQTASVSLPVWNNLPLNANGMMEGRHGHWRHHHQLLSLLYCVNQDGRRWWHVFPKSQLRNSRAKNKRSSKFAFSFKSVYWNLIWYLLTKRCLFMPYWKILFFTCPYLQSHRSAGDSLSRKWKLYLSTFLSCLVWTNRDPVKSIQVLLSIHDPKQCKDNTCRLNMLDECSESDVSTFNRDKKLWEKSQTNKQLDKCLFGMFHMEMGSLCKNIKGDFFFVVCVWPLEICSWNMGKCFWEEFSSSKKQSFKYVCEHNMV